MDAEQGYSSGIFLSDGVAALPSLNFIALGEHQDILAIYPAVFTFLEKNDLLYNKKSLINNNYHIDKQTEVTNKESAELVREEFARSSQELVRPIPTLLQLLPLHPDGNNDFDRVRLFLSNSHSPDDPVSLTIMLSINHADAWDRLLAFRDELTSSLASGFLYSTLGFKFVTAIDPLAFKQMQAFSMRYLGVGLDDPVGVHANDARYGLNSINWQVQLSDHALSVWDEDQIIAISKRPSLLWQTGERPSLCDRNSNVLSPEVAEYSDLDQQLKGLIHKPDSIWLPGIDEDNLERWVNRWDEIKC